MIYNVNKQVDYRKDLPPDIMSAYLHNTMHVQFENYWMSPDMHSEPSLNDLQAWCVKNCQSIFGISKGSPSTSQFYFFLTTDLVQFESHLKSFEQT